MVHLTESQRFWNKVDAPSGQSCWLWTGGKKAAGYGHFSVKRDGRWGKVIAHRYSYETCVGAIPPEHEVDHACGTRSCVNPAHLEAVTVQENRRRRDAGEQRNPMVREAFPLPVKVAPAPKKVPAPAEPATHCRNGHEYAVYGWVRNGRSRTCAECRRLRQRRRVKGNAAADRTHCPKGHEYTEENTYWHLRPGGARHRECRECHLLRLRRPR